MIRNWLRILSLPLFLGVIFCPQAGADIQPTENRMENQKAQEAEATFAGGCFWCMQPPYDNQKGVLRTYVGYTGGSVKDPSYEQVSAGTTGHTEAVRVVYDPAVVSFETLLDIFWRNIDPTQANGQFADRGSQYRTAIFYHNEEQKKQAEASKEKISKMAKFSAPIVVEISPAGDFYRAEAYHQGYYKKNETHYNLYKLGSGRAGFIERTWGKEK